jgi:hypothetical protein
MEKEEFIIRQISIFSENRPGRLAAVARTMEEEEINIYAFSIADANGFGVIRAIVNKPDEAYKKLTEMGFTVSFTDVIAVRMRDEPGGLFDIAEILGEAGINIDYAYAYSGKEVAVLILRVDAPIDAIIRLRDHGAELIRSSVFT